MVVGLKGFIPVPKTTKRGKGNTLRAHDNHLRRKGE
jgi:hypothetical protein